MRQFRRPSTAPLWRDEIAIETADERYVSRRQLTKFLVLTSFGMFVGQLWVVARSWFREPAAPPPAVPVARAGEIPVGGVKVFAYPEAHDPCLLVRRGPEAYVAYSQKCTHLSCAVFLDPAKNRLACPCHNGAFSLADGRVLQGPPQRPLPRIRLERRGDDIVATGIDLGTEG